MKINERYSFAFKSTKNDIKKGHILETTKVLKLKERIFTSSKDGTIKIWDDNYHVNNGLILANKFNTDPC